MDFISIPFDVDPWPVMYPVKRLDLLQLLVLKEIKHCNKLSRSVSVLGFAVLSTVQKFMIYWGWYICL